MAAASPGQGHGGAADSKQDMHFQMSKKLAQLTKVIYSLNTKNDKHEEEVQALKDAHTKELQQHAAETRRHLLELQTKLGDEENMCKKLQNLEKVLAKQERLRHEEKVAFDAYRRKMTREEARTLELERRVLAMKKDLREKTEHFSRLRVRFADDKQAALKELSKVHQLEMEKARKDYDNEISATRQRLEALNDSEKSKEKFNSCQSQSMEEPLEQEPSRCASVNSQNAWQEKDLELRLQFETQEMEIRRTCKEKLEQLQESLRSLEQDLQQSQGENSNLRSENLKFQTELKDNRSELEILRRNLAVAKEKEAVNLRQLKDSQESLQVAREALDQQTELIHKANLISSLEAFKLAQHTSLPEREHQVAHLQNKLNEAERLSTSLQQQKQTLETLYEEEKSLRENQAQESKAQRSVAAEEIQQLKDQHQESLVWINQQHEIEMELILAQTHQKRKALTVDFEQQMQALKLQLVSEVSHANKLHESEIELQSKLEMANKEVSQMQRQLQQSEQGRSSAEAHILNLCEAQKELQAEMQVVQDKVGEAQSSASALQNQLKTERQEFAKQITLQDEGMRRIQQNTKYLKVKWMETMRVECDRIRDTMAAQFRQQRQVSLLELEHKKEQEGAAVQRCWEKQIQELQEQILQYKQTIEEQKSKTETSIWQLQGEHQFQLEQATNSFQAAHQEYLEGLKAVQEAQQQTLQDIKKTHQQEIEDLNNYLQQQNEEALQSHHQAIRLLKEKAQQEMDTARDQWQEQHQNELDELRLELTRQQTATTEQLCRNHKQQLSAGLRERERALESSLKQEREDALRNRELQLSLTDSKQSMHMAQRDNEKLRWELADLENKLKDNARMMKEVQTEVSNHFRNCIEEMKQRLESERQQMTADHVHENQNLLHEYNAAQDLLKEKISTLENELLEAQKAFKQWKPWPEDRERISDLQDLLVEQEHLIRSLMEDKKYYELELANREVNYNKIFNANPKVGIVNPLQKKGDCKNGGAYFINVPKSNSLPIGRRGRLLPPLSGTMQHNQRFSLYDRIFSMTPPSKTKKHLRDRSASSGLPCLNGK